MGSVARAVLEFDEAVQVPWRPSLASSGSGEPTVAPVRARTASPVPQGPRGHATRAGRCTPSRPRVAPATSGLTRVRPSTPGCTHCAGRRSTSPPALRLTLRARRLLALVAVLVAVAAGAWVGSSTGAPGENLRLVGESSVVVRSGDTLWSIARSLAGDGDVRVVVDQLQSLNDLDGAAIEPGQVLLLP